MLESGSWTGYIWFNLFTLAESSLEFMIRLSKFETNLTCLTTREQQKQNFWYPKFDTKTNFEIFVTNSTLPTDVNQ